MFRVKVSEDRVYVIMFHHFQDWGTHHKDGTDCLIFEDREPDKRRKVEELELVACGIAYKNPADQTNKGIGRRTALARALQGYEFSGARLLRTQIWKAYANHVGDKEMKGLRDVQPPVVLQAGVPEPVPQN